MELRLIKIGYGGDAPKLIQTDEYRQGVVPPDNIICLKGVWRLVFRLQSTRGGGADWRVRIDEKETAPGGDLPELLSFGRYNPTLIALIENPMIFWGHRMSCSHNAEGEENLIEQTFLPGYNPFTREIIVISDSISSLPLRTKLIQIAQTLREDEVSPAFTQGNLNIYKLESDIEDELREDNYRNIARDRKAFLNHTLLGGNVLPLLRFRIHNTLYMPAVVWRGIITSPDHLWEPVFLRAGAYLFAHPEPYNSID